MTGIGADQGDVARGVFLTRDPAGAILALYGYDDGSSFSTGQVMAAWLQPNSVNKGTPGLNQPQWVQFRAIRPANGNAFAVGERPCAAFVPLPSTQGTSPCKLPPPGTNKPPQYFKNCTLQKQVMMVASAAATSNSQSQAEALTRFYGTSVAIPEYSTATPSNAQQIALSLVADAFPYPIPDTSVWDNSSPDGTTDWQACAYQYLVGNQSEVEVQIEGGVAFGIKGGTTVDTGVGVVSEASAAVGARAVLNSLRSSYNATSFIVTSKGVPSTAGSPGNNQVFDMSPIRRFVRPRLSHFVARRERVRGPQWPGGLRRQRAAGGHAAREQQPKPRGHRRPIQHLLLHARQSAQLSAERDQCPDEDAVRQL